MNNIKSFYPRLLEPRIIEAMADTPVVLVAGPRQAGKTTLVLRIAEQGMRYLTLDDELTLLAADCTRHTLNDVAQYLGRDVSTMSRQVKKLRDKITKYPAMQEKIERLIEEITTTTQA